MFQALTGTIFSGLVSLSILLLSSYKGNDARFDNFQAHISDRGIRFEMQLVEAFENDFEEIFKSGKTISICFDLQVKERNKVIYLASFKHLVQYDPMNQEFTVSCEDRNVRGTVIENYHEMIEAISRVDYFMEGEFPSRLNVEVTSYLEKMTLESLEKEYDMMILWKYKKPTLVQHLDKMSYEN